MSASRGNVAGEALRSRKQGVCRRSPATAPGRLAGAGLSLVLLSGCLQTPLSTLDPASDVTRSVAALWWTMAVGTGVILILMTVLAALALRRHPPRPTQWRGTRVLLVAGGLGLPTLVITALLAFSLRLDKAQWPPGVRAEAGQAFHVDVIAHQWWWEIRYPGLLETEVGDEGLHTVNVLHAPAATPIHLRITANDVIHSFWVPRIAGKLDAVPGRVNRLRMVVDEPGVYAGVCAEYCGQGHAHMPFTLVAHPQNDRAGLLAALSQEAQ